MKKLSRAIIAVDIGNTSIHIGIFQQSKLLSLDKIATQASLSQLKVSIRLLSLRLKRLKLSIRAIVVCSVVPQRTKAISSLFKKNFKAEVLVCGKDLIVPIKNLYQKPRSVGQDRLLNAFAGAKFYGQPLIIIDFGTAVTFDLVNNRGQYQGGLILPGLGLSLKALHQETALLPQVLVPQEPPRLNLVGRSTSEAMLAGVLFGFTAMVEGLICSLRKELGFKTRVVLTGGDSKLIYSYLKPHLNACLDEYLTLKGLHLLSQPKT